MLDCDLLLLDQLVQSSLLNAPSSTSPLFQARHCNKFGYLRSYNSLLASHRKLDSCLQSCNFIDGKTSNI